MIKVIVLMLQKFDLKLYSLKAPMALLARSIIMFIIHQGCIKGTDDIHCMAQFIKTVGCLIGNKYFLFLNIFFLISHFSQRSWKTMISPPRKLSLS